MKQEVINLIIALTEASHHVDKVILRGRIMNRTLDLKLKEGDSFANYSASSKIVRMVKKFCSEPSKEAADDLIKLIHEIEEIYSD